MGHEDAVQTQLVEKYLLGQLPAAEREGFEEHFFDCELCAEEVRVGILLMDNAAAEFAAAPAVAPLAQPHATPAPERKRARWMDWFRFDWREPNFAFPALALVLVSVFWARDHSQLSREVDLATEPQATTAVPLDVTRGDTPIHVDRDERLFTLYFHLGVDDDTLPDYVIEIQGNGLAPAKVLVRQRPSGKSYGVSLPTARYKPGRYEFTVRGGPDTDGRIVKRFAQSID
jgi:hypothetical protein